MGCLSACFYGNEAPRLATEWASIKDVRPSELFVLASLSLLVFYYGFFPSELTRQYESSVYGITVPYLSKQELNKTVQHQVASVVPMTESPVMMAASVDTPKK